ncbi:uncharacterized protein LOC119286605 isoform X2 [Triticum dicoccoides]|uniref:uncharacterized protein LOC119286605 isoform X2 n=1 Tax=Triticum dicoccoides TaxID=85692 RepID=UPI00188FDD68|nr:uncharacterized protein LOC119286605 isoform X2 [Triticum dicoccoides]
MKLTPLSRSYYLVRFDSSLFLSSVSFPLAGLTGLLSFFGLLLLLAFYAAHCCHKNLVLGSSMPLAFKMMPLFHHLVGSHAVILAAKFPLCVWGNCLQFSLSVLLVHLVLNFCTKGDVEMQEQNLCEVVVDESCEDGAELTRGRRPNCGNQIK